MNRVEHVFVLMLENRSFDHFFALSGIPGVPAVPGMTRDAPLALNADLRHEYCDVQAQIAGGTMSGFPPDALRGFGPDRIDVLLPLAQAGMLFDTWFSSMPGPTWPNRLFAHAASSAGLDNSPGAFDIAGAMRGNFFRFDHDHLFKRLDRHHIVWRIYRSDLFPQVLCLEDMLEQRDTRFRPIDRLASDLEQDEVAAYTFIEPQYRALTNFWPGNSHHPCSNVCAGFALIAYVHHAIFANRAGCRSVLVVTWDEHGGFFDHVAPPCAIPPGDAPLCHERASHPQHCAFDGYGVRVPALVASPWFPGGLSSGLFGQEDCFDHASIVSLVRAMFELDEPLTERDRHYHTWRDALLSTPRHIDPLPSDEPPPNMHTGPLGLAAPATGTVPDGIVMGIANIAADLDWDLAQRRGTSPLITTRFAGLPDAMRLIDRVKRGETVVPAASDAAHRMLRDYVVAVNGLEAEHVRRSRR